MPSSLVRWRILLLTQVIQHYFTTEKSIVLGILSLIYCIRWHPFTYCIGVFYCLWHCLYHFYRSIGFYIFCWKLKKISISSNWHAKCRMSCELHKTTKRKRETIIMVYVADTVLNVVRGLRSLKLKTLVFRHWKCGGWNIIISFCILTIYTHSV